ncbi:hypothetical protein GMRT_12555 [Giardia muris]|uniref:Uncharacterized protein n=1 Tax=Giardia muris TaxID=5742 RepID=A0A4Z1T393_GIAMU|nr:hypothetical protein GMRT_12555 [Giardia muris]|eukprot:TNJ28423.1 hypothetical protein GMRT_12555 [Giardia muris]
MDVEAEVQALEASLRGFCRPSIYLDTALYAAGDPTPLRKLVGRILQACHPEVQQALVTRGTYTQLVHFTDEAWYEAFRRFLAENVSRLDNPSSIPILPYSQWRRRSFAAAKVREVVGFVGTLKKLVPRERRRFGATPSFPGGEDVGEAHRMLRVAFEDVDASPSPPSSSPSASSSVSSMPSMPSEPLTRPTRRLEVGDDEDGLPPRRRTTGGTPGDSGLEEVQRMLERVLQTTQLVNAKVDNLSARLEGVERLLTRLVRREEK